VILLCSSEARRRDQVDELVIVEKQVPRLMRQRGSALENRHMQEPPLSFGNRSGICNREEKEKQPSRGLYTFSK